MHNGYRVLTPGWTLRLFIYIYICIEVKNAWSCTSIGCIFDWFLFQRNLLVCRWLSSASAGPLVVCGSAWGIKETRIFNLSWCRMCVLWNGRDSSCVKGQTWVEVKYQCRHYLFWTVGSYIKVSLFKKRWAYWLVTVHVRPNLATGWFDTRFRVLGFASRAEGRLTWQEVLFKSSFTVYCLTP
jgi:hypothetical protein